MMIFFIFNIIFIQCSSVKAAVPKYLPVIQAVSLNDAIEDYFVLEFTASEIVSFLVIVWICVADLEQFSVYF